MKLVERKNCGCKMYKYATGVEVSKLCQTHLKMVTQGKDIK